MSKQAQHQLRIIGGEWRSRRLRFPAVEGLRPTLDRVRETLFNWMQYDVPGAKVLDAFAGSGALGLEALSRGAKEVVFLEKNPKVAMQLKNNLEQLEASNAQVWAGDAINWLDSTSHDYDLLFLDPPFGKNLLQPFIDKLDLEVGALVYLEYETGLELTLPANWSLHRGKETKEFCFQLYRVEELE